MRVVKFSGYILTFSINSNKFRRLDAVEKQAWHGSKKYEETMAYECVQFFFRWSMVWRVLGVFGIYICVYNINRNATTIPHSRFRSSPVSFSFFRRLTQRNVSPFFGWTNNLPRLEYARMRTALSVKRNGLKGCLVYPWEMGLPTT